MMLFSRVAKSFLEILASTYGLWPYAAGPYGPGPLIIWKNIQIQICFKDIFALK